jgi:hypothetical protein
MERRLTIEGATSEELARGAIAAEAVFAEAGVAALQGAEGMFALERWDIKGFPEDDKPSEEDDWASGLEPNRGTASAETADRCRQHLPL